MRTITVGGGSLGHEVITLSYNAGRLRGVAETLRSNNNIENDTCLTLHQIASEVYRASVQMLDWADLSEDEDEDEDEHE